MATPNAQHFAHEWIEAWNAHDLPRILSHYADDIVFLSPVAQALIGNGRVVGLQSLKSYWAQGLAAHPALKFELREVLVGHEALTILYSNHRQQLVTETFEFAADGKVVRASACYASTQH